METSLAQKLVCTICHTRIFNRVSFRKVRDARISYTTDWKQIQEAQGKGCHWCDMLYFEAGRILYTMNDENQTQYQGSLESVRETASQLRHESITVTVSLQVERNGENLLIVQYEGAQHGNGLAMSCISVCTPHDDLAADFVSSRPLLNEMASERTFDLVRSCHDACVQRRGSHEQCPEYSKPTLPTRVLDCKDPESPRLMSGMSQLRENYAALSYVWGEDQPHKTTTVNIEQYITSGIEMDQTPRTVKDAVRVAHELGIRYLWVDSYCILQDSDEDKIREIRNMRHIFQNSYITIIAAKTPKVSMGFLQNCPISGPSFVVPFFCPNGRVGTATLLPLAWESGYDASKEPTSSRGWCLEERILSPRALIYASHTLQYLCQRGVCNIGDSFNSQIRTGVDRLTPHFFRRQAENTPTDINTARKLTKLWHSVLQDFTRRGLTSPQDRLKAIAGVAEQFHLLLKNNYLAGMWEHHLVGDLLWTKAGEPPLPRPPVYRAPSWSWASVDGIIYYPKQVVEPHEIACDVISCHVDPVKEVLPYGALKGGYLKVKARLFKMAWNSARGLIYWPSPRGELAVVGGGHPDALEDVKVENEVEEVWALPLTKRAPKQSLFPVREDIQKQPVLSGILLKVYEEYPGCYRRVAGFECHLKEEMGREIETFEEKSVTIC